MSKLISLQKKFSSFSGDFDQPKCKKLDTLNRTLTVTITNAGVETEDFVLFGYNEFGDGLKAGSGDNTTISIAQSSHSQVKREMQANPFILNFCMYKGGVRNISNLINYSKKDSTGYQAQLSITPIQYLETSNRYTANGLIFIPDFKGLLFDGQYAITGEVSSSSRIILVLTMETKVAIGNLAYGESVVTKNLDSAPNTLQTINATIQT